MLQKAIYNGFVLGFLSMMLLLETFPKSLYVADYYLHTAKYAAFCINTDKPEMNCNGMCQLDKKLMDLDQHQDQQPQQEKTNTIIVVYLPVESVETPLLDIKSKTIVFPPIDGLLPEGNPNRVARPPQYVA